MPHLVYLSISHQNMLLSPQRNPGTSHLRLDHLPPALTQVLLPKTVHSTLWVILALLTTSCIIASEVPQCFLLTYEYWPLQILGSEIRNQFDNPALHAPKPPPSSWGHSDKKVSWNYWILIKRIFIKSVCGTTKWKPAEVPQHILHRCTSEAC